MDILKNQKTRLRIFMIAVAASLFISANANAQSGNFYVGVSGGVQYTEMEHSKTVDNTNAPADFLQRGKVYSTSDSANKTGFSGGIVAGYRLNLDPSGGFYLGIEAEGQTHDGTARGTLPGDGVSEGRNQRGEAWPDQWRVKRKNSYGVTILLGINPPSLASFLGTGGGVYFLGGVRRLNAELTIDYNGCPIGDRLCRPEELESGADSLDETLNAFTFGGGVEKMIGSKVGIRGEVRRTSYKKETRETFSGDSGIKIPVSLDGSETGLSIKAVVYF